MSVFKRFFVSTAILAVAFGCSDSGPADLSNPTSSSRFEANPNPEGEAITLRMEVPVGTAWEQVSRTEMNMNMSMEQMPQPMNMSMISSTTVSNTVSEVTPDGVLTIQQMISAPNFENMTMNGQQMPAQAMAGMGMGATGGTRNTIQMDSHGKVLDMALDMDMGEQGEGMEDVMNMMMDMFAGSTASFPDQAVHVGDKWITRMDFPNAEDTVIETTCELLRVDEVEGSQVAVIGFHGIIDVAETIDIPMPKGMFPGGDEMVIEIAQLNGRFNGEMHHDLDLGHSVHDTQAINLSLRLHMEIPTPNETQQMDMNLTMSMNVENDLAAP